VKKEAERIIFLSLKGCFLGERGAMKAGREGESSKEKGKDFIT